VPKPAKPATTLFSKRLQSARLELGLSQMQLGVKAGMDETSASGRMNNYERGLHMPDVETSARLAKVLNAPLAYLFSEREDEASLLRALHRMRAAERTRLIASTLEQATPKVSS
jgi:transcriptional regulator with XRE-family HTH domain